MELLHEEISPTIRYIALKYLKNDFDADDLVQDFWADIYKIAAPFISVATLGLGSIGKGILRLIGKKTLAKALGLVITGVAGFLGIGGYFLPQSTALTIASVFMVCTVA